MCVVGEELRGGAAVRERLAACGWEGARERRGVRVHHDSTEREDAACESHECRSSLPSTSLPPAPTFMFFVLAAFCQLYVQTQHVNSLAELYNLARRDRAGAINAGDRSSGFGHLAGLPIRLK